MNSLYEIEKMMHVAVKVTAVPIKNCQNAGNVTFEENFNKSFMEMLMF